MNGTVLAFLLAIIIVGGILFAVVMVTKQSAKPLNKVHYQTKLLEIENSLTRDDTNAQHMAILNADKLVDDALKARGYSGQTMGDRMKSANKVWKNADHIWGAHKVRNRIAHESDTVVTYELAQRTLLAYRQALKDLGAI